MSKHSSLEVIVLGMHRSGTSMVAGMLQHLGIAMGEDYPGKQISNPLGHFEDGDFLSLNIKILDAAGGSWDHPPPYHLIAAQEPNFRNQISKLVESRRMSNQTNIWGWKDPRTSLTLELFFPHLDNPHIIWCQRDHDAVAASLQKRNQLTTSEGHALSKLYVRQIERFFQSHPEIPLLIMPYTQVIADPASWVTRLITFLNLPTNPEQIHTVAEFVKSSKQVQRAKMVWRFKYTLSLPCRALKKVFLKDWIDN